MELNLASTCDVLVLGSGIAGISAALTAAESGASVILVCKGRLFSGSSFYPGTWGLGLVGPADEADEADLISTIEDVGCGMADDALVRALVKGIHPAIEKVRSMGVRLRKADSRSTSLASTISTGTGTGSSLTAPGRSFHKDWKSWV